MLEFLRKNKPIQQNSDGSASGQKELVQIRKRIGTQAALALLTIVLTIVIVFGMTAAWYTNVVQSGGLIFEVEALGVNVNAAIGNATFTAKPGDSGLINLEASNQGTGLVNITVTVSKDNMDSEMRERLYFYVDTQKTANGETSQRTYLTGSQGYTYDVFGGNALTLTDAYYNDAPLKWCWVYDVLGYYVSGQMTNGTMTVEEYLRPIEYDYDLATFDANGNLLTVDGVTTVEEFLTALSQTDGYAGTIDVSKKVGGYYPVDVDSSGYGVYAYLCSYTEIETNTDYDTALGQAATDGNPATYTAKLTVNAANAEMKTMTVATQSDLINMLADETVDTIKLGASFTLSQETKLTIPAGRDVLIDLNNNTLATQCNGTAFMLETGASLTMTNGKLIDYTNSNNAFSVSGADLTLNDVDLQNYYRAIWITDHATGGVDSTVRLTGCTFTTKECAVLLYGNGSDSEQTTKVIIDDCKLTSEDIVICGNGTATGSEPKWGTDIQISNSTIKQQDESIYPDGSDTSFEPLHAPAIYHPQKIGTLNIYNSTVQGFSGIAIKGGTMVVTDSTVIGYGIDGVEEPEALASGCSCTGDGIYIETGYGYDISVTLNGGSVTSYYKMAVRIFEENATWVTYINNGSTLTSEQKGSATEGA